MSFGARAVIRLSALRHNFNVIRTTVPAARIIAVIKGNAYGHGIAPVAAALTDVDALGVARLSEALTLRGHGIKTNIVVLAGVNSHDDLLTALQHHCDLVVHSEAQIALLEESPAVAVRVWLKIDTGMHRLGIDVGSVPAAIERLSSCCAPGKLGLMSHLASADEINDEGTLNQIGLLAAVSDGFPGDVSIANSAAIFGWGDALRDLADARQSGDNWVRPGIALFGVSPFSHGCGADLGLQPVMDFESRLLAVKAVRAGDGVGYGAAWRAHADTIIGLVSAGYGDGYSRYCPSGTPVLVNGRRVPLAGRVSMDSCAVDLGPQASESPGDEVLLWGEGLPVEEIARHAGTIPYQLLCGVTHREAPRIIQ